jgi:outer membrane protein
LAAESATVNEALPNRIQGDLGVLVDKDQSPIRGDNTAVLPLPFAYFDYGRMYARLDTFGIKTLPVGYGYLEIAGRVKFDGYNTANNPALKGIGDRQNSVPVGLGTFQLTPIGGFFFYALHDINRSQGNLFEADYVAEFEFGGMTLYPEAGVEYYTSQYNRYYYGVSQAEAAASGYAAYSPGSAAVPFLSLWLEVPVMKNWNADLYVRHKWLGAAISNSPLVGVGHLDSGFVALVRHFE